MNIAILCPTFLPRLGGMEIVEYRLAEEVSTYPGYNVSVIMSWANWRQVRHWVPFRVLPIINKSDRVHFRLPNYRALVALAEAQLAIYQRIYHFDVWHVHSAFPSGSFAANFLQKKNLPCLLTCHGYDIRCVPEIKYGARLNPVVDRMVRNSLPKYSRIVAISDSLRQDILKCDIAPEQIVDIPNGSDIQRIQATTVAREAVRSQLGISSTQKLLLSVGKNTPVKGFDLIPKVITELLRTRDDFVWILVGQDSSQIEQQAVEAGVDAYLKCLPALGQDFSQHNYALPSEALIQYYKASDLFVSTSRSEGFGLVLIEAMAAGLPLVSTDASGCRDIVNPSVGYTSAVDDVVGLANNILRMLGDDTQAAVFKENALANSREFDWSIIGRRYANEYQAVVDLTYHGPV